MLRDVNLEETESMLNRETKPCESKSVRWLCRLLALLTTALLLISMSFVAWNQYSSFMKEDDNEVPQPVAMFNGCYNQSWNIIQEEINLYKILYYEKILYDEDMFIDTNCNLQVSFPYIDILNSDKCCRFIIWNTI